MGPESSVGPEGSEVPVGSPQDARARLRVMLSVRGPSTTTNPYVVLLARAMPPDVEMSFFSWRRALLGRYDVLHVHWPEVMVRRASRPARWWARARFAALLLRLAGSRAVVVRTLHNVRTHEGGDPVERALLGWLDRLTRGWVRLSSATPLPAEGVGAVEAVVPHGHYRDWFAVPPAGPQPGGEPGGDPGGEPGGERGGRLLYFGLVRAYKGVEQLLSAFAALEDPGAELRVVGLPSGPSAQHLAGAVSAATQQDARVSARLEYAPDDVLAAEVRAARLVVLPYRDMHNSGALLLALSLDRPVLVPRTPTTTQVAAEVGPGWVRTFDGELTAADLAEALREVEGLDVGPGRPDLSRRDWPGLGREHAAVYRAAQAAQAARARRR